MQSQSFRDRRDFIPSRSQWFPIALLIDRGTVGATSVYPRLSSKTKPVLGGGLAMGLVSLFGFPLTVLAQTTESLDQGEEIPVLAQTTESLDQGEEIPVLAQTTESLDDGEEIEETELVIQGEAEPVFAPTSAPSYVIPQAEIERRNPRSTAELLQSLPGFAINDYGFGADIHTGTFLRGFSINQSNFQINGRSFGSNISTYHGATDLNSIPVGAIERVELTGGTSATLYGSEAFGGVVNLVTQQEPQPLTGHLGVELGSHGHQRYRIGTGGTLGNVTLRLGYERLSADNEYSVPPAAANFNPANGKLFNGDTHIDNFYGGFELPINGRNHFSLDAYKSASRRGLLYFGFPLQRDRLNHDLFNIGATLTTQLDDADRSTLKTTIGFNQDLFDTYGPAGNNYRSGTLDSQSISGRLEHTWQFTSANNIIWGMDIKADSLGGTVLDNRAARLQFNGPIDEDRLSVALFALNTWKPIDTLQVEVGLRQNFNTAFGNYLNPTLGTRWDITPRVALRGSFAALQRNPGLDQLYVFDTVHNWQPNPDLEPERGLAYTAGMDLNLTDSFLAQVTYFGSTLDDRLGIIAGRWENVGKVDTNGLEVGLRWQILPELSSFLNYTYTDAEIKSSLNPAEVGLQLSTVPYSVGKLGLAYEFQGWQANLFLNYYSGSRRAVFAQTGVPATDFSPAYLSLDFNGRIPVHKNVGLTLGLENLTNHRYEKTNRIYQPGLTFRLGVQADL